MEKDADPAARFDAAVGPFLKDVWPADKTLRSKGLSAVLAAVPAAAGTRFAAAVDAIAALLTPFDAWTLYDFGYIDRVVAPEGRVSRQERLIETPEAALAWLKLLDLCIGRGADAIHPNNLGNLLDQIAAAHRPLVRDARFQRLLSLSRA